MSKRYLAKPRLKERIIALNGGTHGYLHRLRGAMARHAKAADVPSVDFLWQVLNRHKGKATPVWQVVEMVRFAERKPDMDYLEALDLAPEWFDIEGSDSE